ncbi:MAG: hypothetical protein Q9187_005280 [Circinaria calcarea]
MSDPDEVIFASTPFKFIVEGKSLYIHSALVAKHSKPLDRMINGRMSEAQKGFAVLDDVDVGTFTRFIRWAYTGYYFPAAHSAAYESSMESPMFEVLEERGGKIKLKKPIPEVELVTSPIPSLSNFSVQTAEEPTVEVAQVSEFPASQAAVDSGWSGFSRHSKKDKKSQKAVGFPPSVGFGQQRSSKTALKESFIELGYAFLETHPPPPPPRSNRDNSEDYTEVFLSHTRLYVFAEKYDIQPLKPQAIQNLHQTLAIYTLYLERAGDIVELIRYVYANTADVDDGVEDLRELLVRYIGFEMDILVKAPEFKELLVEDGGALLGDFLRMVEKRI